MYPMSLIVKLFIIALVLTVIIELLIGFLLGIRSLRGMAVVTLMNTLTNPLAVLIYLLLLGSLPSWNPVLLQFPIEAAVLFTEWRILKGFSEKGGFGIQRPFFTAFCMNLSSYLAGFLIRL